MYSPPEKQTPHGLTLIELVVTITLVVLVSGILLGILINSRRSVTTGQTRLAMQSQARAVCDEVISILDGAVPPGSLDGSGQPVARVFGPTRCALVSSAHLRDGNFYLTTMESVTDPATDRKLARVSITVLDAARTSGTARETKNREMGSSPELSTTIEFEYATEVNPAGLQPVFLETLPEGTYPRLVRVRVQVENPDRKDGDPGGNPVEVTASVKIL